MQYTYYIKKITPEAIALARKNHHFPPLVNSVYSCRGINKFGGKVGLADILFTDKPIKEFKEFSTLNDGRGIDWYPEENVDMFYSYL